MQLDTNSVGQWAQAVPGVFRIHTDRILSGNVASDALFAATKSDTEEQVSCRRISKLNTSVAEQQAIYQVTLLCLSCQRLCAATVELFEVSVTEDATVLQGVCCLRKVSGHANIVRFYGAYEDESFMYIFLERCDGGCLAGLSADKGALTQQQLAVHVQQLISAIQHSHLQGTLPGKAFHCERYESMLLL